MPIAVGEKLPEASFVEIGADGPSPVSVADLTSGRKVAMFAVPGAYTPTCHMKHVPSFVENADALREKGIDDIVCVSVNDPFVMKAWGE
ncbi:MAG: redoxin family protein, partial [Pseudomonadota bacterium]